MHTTWVPRSRLDEHQHQRRRSWRPVALERHDTAEERFQRSEQHHAVVEPRRPGAGRDQEQATRASLVRFGNRPAQLPPDAVVVAVHVGGRPLRVRRDQGVNQVVLHTA